MNGSLIWQKFSIVQIEQFNFLMINLYSIFLEVYFETIYFHCPDQIMLESGHYDLSIPRLHIQDGLNFVFLCLWFHQPTNHEKISH